MHNATFLSAFIGILNHRQSHMKVRKKNRKILGHWPGEK